MTERGAQQAAISSFGPVRAVTRAHLARLTRGKAVLAHVGLAAWKLVSLLLLAAGVSGMAAIVVTGFSLRLIRPWQLFTVGPGPNRITSDHLTFNLISGAWTQTFTWTGPHPAGESRGSITWLAQPVLGWHTAVLLAAAGLVLLAGYALARRRSPREPLARLFPAVAVSVFGAIGLALLVVGLRTRIGMYDPRAVIAACLAITLGYAVRLGQVLLRQR